MSEPYVIGADIDGVFADFNGPFSGLLSIIAGRTVGAEWTSWNYPLDMGMVTQIEWSKAWEIVYATEFMGGLPPLPFAPDVLSALDEWANEGLIEVHFLTARQCPRAQRLSQEWLEAWGFSSPSVIPTLEKGSVARSLGLDVMIEDSLTNLLEVRAMCPGCHCLLLDRPYNQHPDPSIRRVANLDVVGVTLGMLLEGD